MKMVIGSRIPRATVTFTRLNDSLNVHSSAIHSHLTHLTTISSTTEGPPRNGSQVTVSAVKTNTTPTPQKEEAEERKMKLVQGKMELEDLEKNIDLETEKMKRLKQMVAVKKESNLQLEQKVESVVKSKNLQSSQIVDAIIKDLPAYRRIVGDFDPHASKLQTKSL